jgi:hypothetical protein
MKMKTKAEHITECLVKLAEAKKYYVPLSSGWILISTAEDHIKSLQYLVANTKFDDKTLDVKQESDN